MQESNERCELYDEEVRARLAVDEAAVKGMENLYSAHRQVVSQARTTYVEEWQRTWVEEWEKSAFALLVELENDERLSLTHSMCDQILAEMQTYVCKPGQISSLIEISKGSIVVSLTKEQGLLFGAFLRRARAAAPSLCLEVKYCRKAKVFSGSVKEFLIVNLALCQLWPQHVVDVVVPVVCQGRKRSSSKWTQTELEARGEEIRRRRTLKQK